MLKANEQYTTRRAWCEALRKNGHRKCEGAFIRIKFGETKHCAIGLFFAEVLKTPTRDTFYSIVIKKTGIPAYAIGAIIRMNDEGNTFHQIADYIEQLP